LGLEKKILNIVWAVGFCLLACSSSAQLIPRPFSKLDIESVEDKIRQTTNKDSLGYLYLQLGRKMISNDSEQSIANYDRAIALGNEVGNTRIVGLASLMQAIPLINNGKYIRAQNKLNFAENYFESTTDTVSQGSCLIFYGFLETSKENYEKASAYLMKALALNQKIGFTLGKCDALNRLGIIANSRKEYDKALGYFNQIIESAEATGKSYFLTAAIHNSGLIYSEKGDYDKAEEFLNESLERRKNRKSNSSKTQGFNALAVLEERRGDFKTSMAYRDSMIFYQKLGKFSKSLIETYVSKNKIYLSQNSITAARREIDLALKELKNINSHATKHLVFQANAATLKVENKSSEAYEYLVLSQTYRDSLYKTEQQESAEKFNRLLSAERYALEINQLQGENNLQQLAIQKQNTFVAYMIAALLLLGGFLLFLQFRNRLRKKQNDELAEKNSIIQKSLEDREILLREIHHRVKNNLQIVSSMLNLQTRYVKDEKALKAVIDSRDRVKSMALIHQKLYQHDNLKGVSIDKYFRTLVSGLMHSYQISEDNVQVHFDLSSKVILDVDTMIPIGLIVNELITNSLKYAFPNGRKGNLWINFDTAIDHLYLKIADDGKGMDDLEDNQKNGFGFTLIKTLSDKLKADMKINSSSGTIIEMKIKKYIIVSS